MPLIVTPARCYLPDALTEGPGIWGISAAAIPAALPGRLGYR